jgi:uncharacterized protein YdaU (DUF1376 family)
MTDKKLKAPAFQFYVQDFLTGVHFLNMEERGMYITLLCYQWDKGEIPKKRLGFLAGKEWENLSDDLREKFTDCGDHIINERLEIERNKKLNFIEKQSQNGAKGGRPKKAKQKPPIKKEETQKNPLEDRSMKNEVEDKEIKESVKTIKAETIVADSPEDRHPEFFLEKKFKDVWVQWQNYKREQFKFTYKPISLARAKIQLYNESEGNLETAVGMLSQAIANGWKGWYKPKKEAVSTNTGRKDFA